MGSPQSKLGFYSRFRMGLLFQVLPSNASTPEKEKEKRSRTAMDRQVPSSELGQEENEENDFASTRSEASDGSEDNLSWLNAYASSTFRESSSIWINRKSGRDMTTTAQTPRSPASDFDMHAMLEDVCTPVERDGREGSPFLCYEKYTRDTCSDVERSPESKFLTINRWLDSASHFLDVAS